jgi:chemotaxis protein histidine kinase CheA
MRPAFRLPHETLDVCPVESGGVCYALPERDVMGVLTLDDDGALEEIGGLLAVSVDGLRRPLISLRASLCQPAGEENVLVVLRIGGLLFGLLVDQAFEPAGAATHPTLGPAPALPTFSHIVRLEDGRDIPMLNPASLAQWAQPLDGIRALRLAA